MNTIQKARLEAILAPFEHNAYECNHLVPLDKVQTSEDKNEKWARLPVVLKEIRLHQEPELKEELDTEIYWNNSPNSARLKKSYENLVKVFSSYLGKDINVIDIFST